MYKSTYLKAGGSTIRNILIDFLTTDKRGSNWEKPLFPGSRAFHMVCLDARVVGEQFAA